MLVHMNMVEQYLDMIDEAILWSDLRDAKEIIAYIMDKSLSK